ncbi:hypothetical protein ASD21_07350 [Caulobacter sp. Root1455]|jgi:hypothetical protein|uniref:DUF6265 family protein n=1 Tax=unclassified Caulobacter TaxID=2648921 RepID=UPI0006FCDCB4|nr:MULTISPECIES: DUF6265 family protein [unclassified Caulobacter]KQY30882.1 hypothetical protein ASD38_05830 [Caulobacter sp. Root487D2Y]KQY95174.1 hypothetical protein ASD21_07350 [Caulobacter sp. Root1455]
MLALALAAALAGPPATIDQMAWLKGCWIQTKPGGVVEERWMGPGGGVMLGMGRTLKDGKLRDYEFTRIVEADGSLAYMAEPSGQEKATFPLKSLTPEMAVFENPAHDFPQRVIYRRLGADEIIGRIEGQIGGQARSVDFPYKRCETGN